MNKTLSPWDEFALQKMIFWENWVNTMAVDALALCIARSLAAMELTM